MISILVTTGFILMSLKWGDWKNWKMYYPTMLYMVLNAVLFNVLTYEQPTWEWNDNSNVFPNHTTLDLWIIYTQFPVVVLLYLSNFPEKIPGKIGRLLLWVGIFTGLEVVVLQIDYIVHTNGWTIWWSIFFNFVTFIMLRLHFKFPIITWAISIIFIGFLCIVFDISFSMLR